MALGISLAIVRFLRFKVQSVSILSGVNIHIIHRRFFIEDIRNHVSSEIHLISSVSVNNIFVNENLKINMHFNSGVFKVKL